MRKYRSVLVWLLRGSGVALLIADVPFVGNLALMGIESARLGPPSFWDLASQLYTTISVIALVVLTLAVAEVLATRKGE